jgi:hypothetical protein
MDELDLDTVFDVDSSNIAAIGTKDHFLVIKFVKGGAIYRYPYCQQYLEQIYTADSVGRAFREIVLPIESGERLRDGWPEED